MALIKQYDKWISQKKKLSKQYSLPKNKRQKDIAELEEMANDLEKELVKGSQEFSKINDLQQLTWENVKDNLKSDEAAIEYVYFKYRDKIWTDSTFYCALVLRSGYQNPKMIRLFEEKELEALLGRYRGNNLNYINGIYGTNTRSKKALYNLIWQPIDSLLSDVKTVYISPSGLLHKVSFAALGNKINWYLTDNFSIQIQSTTAKVALPESFSLDKELNACIFGGIQYNTDSTKTEIWKYLVGTKTEAENISKILKKKKVNVEFISGNNANEEIFKNNASKNNIIHIATHGFFYPDPEETKKAIDLEVSSEDITFRGGNRGFGVESFVENKNPLMRSGLVFAGANDVWSRTEVEGEDGVLTAYEISTLNLRNTQLAVLSACETGLGDIRGSEGVYGLQRAFKMAGVKYLIMSLWQVPDKETEEFMTTFYKKLLKIKDIKRAFNETQSKMRQKYDPYYWAAFVLIE